MWSASPVSLRKNEKVGTTFRWTMVKEKCSDFLKEAKPSGGVKSLSDDLWCTLSLTFTVLLSKVAVNASLSQNVLNIVELWRGRSFFRRSSAHSRFPFRCLLAAALENIWFSDYKSNEACVYKMIRGEATDPHAALKENLVNATQLMQRFDQIATSNTDTNTFITQVTENVLSVVDQSEESCLILPT